MMRTRTIGGVLVALFLSACSTHPARPVVGGRDATAAAPDVKPGDEWRYTGGFYVRVIGVRDGEITTKANIYRDCADCTQIRDTNGTIVRVLDGKGLPYAALPGEQLLDFPLWVGKEWRQDIRLPASTGGASDYTNSFRVEAFEEITVKAGTFKAFRISQRQENRGAYRWNGQAEWWYAPDVKGLIKRSAYTSQWGRDWELESYKLSQ